MAPTDIKLDPQAVEAIAQRVAELLDRGEGARDRGLIDAAELARRLGMERDWVYANASELGAVRMGTGSKPRLRFDPQVAVDRMPSIGADERDSPRRPTHRRRRERRAGSAPLLPIKGEGSGRDLA